MEELFILFLIVVIVIIIKSIKQINEYERGILFSFGKYTKVLEPGWTIVLPIIQSYRKVDIRTKAVDVPEQDAITKDNVSIRINAVIYYKVFDAGKAICEVENFYYAVGQLAQTTMRNIVGSVTLDELLSERDKISSEICAIIDKASDPWGIKVENLAKAATMMGSTPGALHLRTLSTLNDLSSDQSNTVIFAIPIEVLDAVKGLGNKLNNNNHKQGM